MGFDVLGKAPRSKAGEIFATNRSGWREIVNVCFDVAPDICKQLCAPAHGNLPLAGPQVRPAPGERFDLKFWVSNDGFGLDSGACALADALRAADAGSRQTRVRRMTQGYPKESCKIESKFGLGACRHDSNQS